MRVDNINGLIVNTWSKHSDVRGTFQRIYDFDLVRELGVPSISQISVSTNSKKHTLRGLHGLTIEANEYKLVQCIEGEVFDVVVDLRKDSNTYMDHFATILSGEKSINLIIPPGCVHGYLSLSNQSTILYAMTAPYDPSLEIGANFADKSFEIEWPASIQHISDKDLAWKLHGE